MAADAEVKEARQYQCKPCEEAEIGTQRDRADAVPRGLDVPGERPFMEQGDIPDVGEDDGERIKIACLPALDRHMDLLCILRCEKNGKAERLPPQPGETGNDHKPGEANTKTDECIPYPGPRLAFCHSIFPVAAED